MLRLSYWFRVLERSYGTAKFGAFVAVVTGLSSAASFALTRTLKLSSSHVTGPYGVVFACVVQVGGAALTT